MQGKTGRKSYGGIRNRGAWGGGVGDMVADYS